MTTVLAVRSLQDCVDGIVAREYVVDRPIDEPAMRRLAEGGRLSYYPSFPRPYSRIEIAGVVIQGVIGNCTFRATLPAPAEGAVHHDVSVRLSKGEGDG
jgi:hypothetical protein